MIFLPLSYGNLDKGEVQAENQICCTKDKFGLKLKFHQIIFVFTFTMD